MVRVEHVTVQAGGQAIVGAVTQGWGPPGSEDRPHAQRAPVNTRQYEGEPSPCTGQPWPMHLSPRCGARPAGQPVPIAGGEGQGTVPDARRGRRQRRPAGNRNALRHGRYTRELIEFKANLPPWSVPRHQVAEVSLVAGALFLPYASLR